MKIFIIENRPRDKSRKTGFKEDWETNFNIAEFLKTNYVLEDTDGDDIKTIMIENGGNIYRSSCRLVIIYYK